MSQSAPRILKREDMPYRNCAAAAIFNREGKVFIACRLPETGDDQSEIDAPWQMPQGGIDSGEEPLPAAKREVFEETNITSLRLIAEAPEWISYDLPDAALGIALKGKYRGQRQRWFAFAFTGEDGEIDVRRPGGGKFKPEFNTWRWEDLGRTPELIVPFKREAYVRVVQIFAEIPAQVRGG
jgi:putative (di)nucleoside polyphosphate hydrolase